MIKIKYTTKPYSHKFPNGLLLSVGQKINYLGTVVSVRLLPGMTEFYNLSKEMAISPSSTYLTIEGNNYGDYHNGLGYIVSIKDITIL